jgi:hypothetical protein
MGASGADVSEIEGLRDAVDRHEAALLSGDKSRLSETVLFPHVQFYPDGRAAVIEDRADLAEAGESPAEWRVSDRVLVTHENDLAIVRASFEGTGERAGADLGAGLWCFTLRGGAWLVSWRHFLGPNANH